MALPTTQSHALAFTHPSDGERDLKRGFAARPVASFGAPGFALVATLSLMILLTILAVGLLSLSAVTLRSSGRASAQAEARANARMALMLAIGELQKEMEPDMRINAAADLKGSGLGDERRRWVGTWESWPAGQDQRPEPQFRRWLVSGTPASLGDPEFPGRASCLVPLIRGNNPLFPTLRPAPMALSGASRRKQIPSSQPKSNMAGTRNPFGRRPHPGSRIHLKIRADSPTNCRRKKSWQSGLESYARNK